jgi:hypothetical protein
MAQPDTITKRLPEDGKVGVARVLQVIRDEAARNEWCSEAEESVLRFLGIDVMPYYAPRFGGRVYCCPACNGGVSAQEFADGYGVKPDPGYSFNRFTPMPGQPEFIPTKTFVKFLKSALRVHGRSYTNSLNRIGAEVLGNLWIGFSTPWTHRTSFIVSVDVPIGQTPTLGMVLGAFDAEVKALRDALTADKFYAE